MPAAALGREGTDIKAEVERLHHKPPRGRPASWTSSWSEVERVVADDHVSHASGEGLTAELVAGLLTSAEQVDLFRAPWEV